jgi:hypothetical protein
LFRIFISPLPRRSRALKYPSEWPSAKRPTDAKNSCLAENGIALSYSKQAGHSKLVGEIAIMNLLNDTMPIKDDSFTPHIPLRWLKQEEVEA